jgi:hypothetical protein
MLPSTAFAADTYHQSFLLYVIQPLSKYVRLPKSCGQYTFNLEYVLQTPSLAQQQVLT